MGFQFEREALIASGLDDEKKIDEYHNRLVFLSRQCMPRRIGPSSSALSRARYLFNGLWRDRQARYRPGGHFRLHNVIDAQIRKGSTAVGNCLGLTLLYNCLLNIVEIPAKAVYLEHAFNTGPHLITLLEIDHSRIDIENILAEGFDYTRHKDNPSRTLWGDRELVADIYHSTGNEYFEKGVFSEALRSYEKALELYPDYDRAALNRVIVLDRMNR